MGTNRIFTLLFFFIGYMSIAQTDLTALKKIDTINISDIKTTHLLFKEQIKYLDVGSQYFVTDTLNKVIKLKHTGKSLNDPKSKETNLTVLTKEGSFYSLNLRYSRNPKDLTYTVESNKAEKIIDNYAANQSKDEHNLLCDKKFKLDQSKKIGYNDKIAVHLRSVFYDKEKVYLVLNITNHSNITFDVGDILFRTKLNKKPRKDFVYQEQQFKPIAMCGKFESIYPKTMDTIIFVFNKFTFTEEEKFQVDIIERNGGRTVYGYIKRKDFFQNEEI